jgi:hypothetical protein
MVATARKMLTLLPYGKVFEIFVAFYFKTFLPDNQLSLTFGHTG